VLERGSDVGGTWHHNTYPGCQCDIPSNLYSLSFAPKPDWSHSYPEQREIQRSPDVRRSIEPAPLKLDGCATHGVDCRGRSMQEARP